MRGTLGFLLIAAGLMGTYLVLSGKFPPSQAAQGSGTISQPSGSGAMSVQSAYTQLGTTIGHKSTDMRAAKGLKS